ncbi:hypothetical protein ACT8ZV_13770 [Nocardioides sp. MAHUQ-72]|uniref:hypothetical protein n=1 Tax=unclassified Nocardioides TaxID=2615069 RepID=UPI003616610B
MALPDLYGDLRNALQELNDQLELKIDQAAIDNVMATLDDRAIDVHHSRFTSLSVPTSAFGASSKGLELGDHHAKAHEVIRETLHGVLADLNAFKDGLVRAEKLVRGADESAAADLDRKRAADILVDVAHRSQGDRRNHEARNQLLGDGGASS